MSSIVQTGTVDGFPIYGYAPCPVAVPPGFELTGSFGSVEIACTREDCEWTHLLRGGGPLTEAAALATEHVAMAHGPGAGEQR